MANPTPPAPGLQALVNQIGRLHDRMDELGRFDASQYTRAVEKLTALVEALPAQIDAALAIEVNTGDVNATGDVAAVNVNATGRVTSAEALRSPGSRTFNMTSSWAGLWVNFDGTIGISTSSERFKENIEPLDKEQLSEALYRAVPVSYTRIGGEAAELGFIAERFVEIGLGAFVFYDADDQVEGIHYDRISIALVAALQTQRAQLLSLEQRLAALEGATA